MIEYDYSKLLGRMKEKRKTQETLARDIGINAATLSQKLNNHSDFTQDEIIQMCNILEIGSNMIHEYFFTQILMIS